MYTQEDIDHAKEILRRCGYQVRNLWHIEDIDSEELTEDEKLYILHKALTNESVTEQIFDAIKMEKETLNISN